jgi:hypothetical protein
MQIFITENGYYLINREDKSIKEVGISLKEIYLKFLSK